MTLTTALEVSTRSSRDTRGDRLFTFRDDFIIDARSILAQATALSWPSPIFIGDPLAFADRILGIELWEKQQEILLAIRDHKRVAIKSGHKIGKSRVCATAALWKYCTFPDARVVMTSTTARQVDAILWRELRMLYARAGRCVACKLADPEGFHIPRPCPHSALISGDLGDLAKTGLKSVDFREIVGFTATQAEAVAGISGSQLTFICDEASGIPDLIFEAIEGNRAGSAQLIMTGNPTKNEGEFFEAFHSKSRFYHLVTVSSEETPNAVSGTEIIPGLASSQWIEEKREEWGETSPMYLIRVKGEFALGEDGRIFSTHTIMQAEQRWELTEPAGRLFVGIDPAGETGSGDDSALSVRRGLKQLEIRTKLGLTSESHLDWALEVMQVHALPRETPVLVIDRTGAVGYKFYRTCLEYLDQPQFRHAPPFELVSVRASDRAQRQPLNYALLRDELVANLERWLRDGGAILTDSKLSKEMHALEWKQDIKGRYRVTNKDLIRKAIGRSPDRFDALCLSVWEPKSLIWGAAANDNDNSPEAGSRRAANDNNKRAAVTPEETINGGTQDDYYSALKAFR